MNKLNVKKGDTVVVISGKDKGKQGKILAAMPEDQRVIVQNVNMITAHVKPRKQGEEGGRISKVAGVFGGLLDICPLLNMDNLGRLIPRSKIRGKKRVLKEIVARMEEHAQGGLDYSGKCYISNSACYDDARAVADAIEQKFPKLNGKVEIYSVGTTIGSHTGPGTGALFFWGDERKD